jgi:FAD/FMN-containing dehydrogenase
VTALLALPSTQAALDVLASVRTSVRSLEAAEITFRREIDLVVEHTGMPKPFPTTPPVCLLLECAGQHDPTDELAGAILSLPEVSDTRVADDEAGRAALWAWRERHSEVVHQLGVPHKLDVALPLSRLAEFERKVRTSVITAYPDATVMIWGHIGDGNLHVNIVGPSPEDETVDDMVLRLVADHDGSISAEHGIGRAKRRWLELSRSPADIAAMRAIRQALDPDGILNPGVLF